MRRKKTDSRHTTGAFIIVATLTMIMCACASMGRPEGGARDETPPVYVRSNPTPSQREYDRQRIDVWFDENIQLDDAFNKVIVSPTQTTAPVVRSLGKHVYVELRDSLLPNTTYTIDFADAIKDLNEGNILDGFALDFSTGKDLDTLRISGMVLEARTLEPAQGMMVGLYSSMTDTTLTTLPFERVARTNQYGQFTIRNLKPGNYTLFAVNDVNRDNHWDRSEDIAFIGKTISPYVEDIMVSDTLRTDDGTDSIATRPGLAYFPNDVLLTWFNENFRSQYLRDHARPERRRVTIGMGAPSDTLPTLTIVGGSLDGQLITDHAVLQKNPTNDTLSYWLRTPELIATDSLLLDIRHEFTDSLDRISWANDTIRFFWKEPKQKKKKDNDTLPPPIELLPLKVTSTAAHDIYAPLHLVTQTPIASVDTLGVRLRTMVDSVWTDVPVKPLTSDPLNPMMDIVIDFDRTPGAKYRFTVDSTAVTDIYGIHNKEFTHEFTVRQPEEYSNLRFNILNTDSTDVIVELLDASDKPVRTIKAQNGVVTIPYINPGTYYARLFLDANGNGKWDTGNVTDSIQPEEVYYYNQKLDLKANWDIEQRWDIYEFALDAQKPYAIKQNKPKLKKGETDPNADADVEYDEWGEPIDRNDPRYGRGTGNNRGNGGFGNFGNALGGFQQSGGNEAIQRRR